MNARRSFFKRLGAIVATVALAPQIAFSRKLEFVPKVTPSQTWWTRTNCIARRTSEDYKLNLQTMMENIYAIRKERESMGIRDDEILVLMSREQATIWEQKYPVMIGRYIREQKGIA